MPESVLLKAWEQSCGHMGSLASALHLAETRTPLTVDHLLGWQAQIVDEQRPFGVWIAPEDIGRLRVKRMRMIGKPPFAHPDELPQLIKSLLDHVNATLQKATADVAEMGLALAAATHHRYERVHPFADGNGRTGRLVVLYILRYLRLPPVLFTAGDKTSGYFRTFDLNGPEGMLEYFREHQVEVDPWADS